MNKSRAIILFFLTLTIMVSSCRDKGSPSCYILEPSNYSFFGKGEVVEILVDADDPNGNHLEVQFFINGEGKHSTTSFPYRFSWDTKGYEKGVYLIKARVIDSEGLVHSDTSQITIGISTPRLITADPSAVTLTSAVVGGTILTNGGASVFETGIYYGTIEEPEKSGDKQVSSIIGEGFQTSLTGLSTNSTYFYKAYAVNEEGENFGEQKYFKTLGNELGSFTDSRDGRTYKWVRIANQTWMAENLAYLPQVNMLNDGSKYSSKYYVYNYNGNSVSEAKLSDYYQEYGALYNYYAALNSCPSGWHLPSDDEWKILESNLGMLPISVDNAGWRGTNEGRSLKARSGWKSSGNGSNISDFTAIPGGYRSPSDSSEFETIYSNFWVAREYNITGAWCRYLYYNNTGIYRGTFSKDFGFSVRCIKD
ncbi:MAG: hypothetical protein K9H49_19215 [Bacteroidales bacterium]|nr:hypothetical protein [Bacteroidales bacterium]MCF8391761.1 hypothetical protein [Bacteroidales bacterium]